MSKPGFASPKSPRSAERLDPGSGEWTPLGEEFDLPLVRGGGALLRLGNGR